MKTRKKKNTPHKNKKHQACENKINEGVKEKTGFDVSGNPVSPDCK